MKKIDFKKPRYALPLICLPFLMVFFYVYKSSYGKDGVKVVGTDSLQTGVAGVSAQVRNQELSGKLDAFRNKFKQADGYTAVGTIDEENMQRAEVSSSYNSKEKRMLDSIDQVLKAKYGVQGSESSKATSHFYSGATYPGDGMLSSARQDKALADALSKIKHGKTDFQEQRSEKLETDPMQLFRQQMALVDSMGKANDPALAEKRERERQSSMAEKEEKSKIVISVRRSISASGAFNTIISSEQQRPISAIIDQDITGFSGSRLRIRLTDDILAGKFLIRKGTYLYATISGFSAQRVTLIIQTVFYNGEILPVNLQVYDNDGLPGIYVPSSAFREFTRDLGASSSQGITIQQMAENNNQMVMGVLSKMFQSATTAVNKLIRSNKVKVKYNTQVYLIDPSELKRKQQTY
ncbi:conjugative transposon protein TraM [Pedobacter endophyticus]|uniref:Conjugative transposon protein TraM n=1 Tax=Pedobacter endophyticus TaxID=2789740 RepID=A0A7U3Q6J2_9SPHI|nr:conjugative transposon protein TraM [Pedobacter endophyticus]QPH38675.1 conjugative transposon protein TraM [Pedobacter endophyticus]